MKIGLDIHGVIDANPELFSALSKMFIAAGAEVHIITGPKFSQVEDILKKHDIAYTHFCSIVEEAVKQGHHVRWADENNPWIDDKDIWDKIKAVYCKEHGIDLHIDDSSVYGQHFETPYLHYKHGGNK